MTHLVAFFVAILSFVSLISAGHAEVHFGHEVLTVHVDQATLKEVLDDIRQQGNFEIVALDDTKIGNVRISKQFWNLPLEIGLDRLLSGWNYGISRNGSTGKIISIYLVSQRPQPESLPRDYPSHARSSQQDQAPKERQDAIVQEFDSDDFFDDEEYSDEGSTQ